MLFSSRRISKTYNLHDSSICKIDHNGIYVERVSEWKILGIKFNDHLECNSHFQDLVKSYYQKLAQLPKIKRFTPYALRKQLLSLSFSNVKQKKKQLDFWSNCYMFVYST